ncbi:hypothetical protein BGZ57DRAFT_904123, partial [Hyaloscypha finlandica]
MALGLIVLTTTPIVQSLRLWMGLEERGKEGVRIEGRGDFTLKIIDGKEGETAAFIGTVTCQGSIDVRALGSLAGKDRTFTLRPEQPAPVSRL